MLWKKKRILKNKKELTWNRRALESMKFAGRRGDLKMNIANILSDLDAAEEEVREANRMVMEARENKKRLEQDVIKGYLEDPEFRRYLKIDTAKMRREHHQDRMIRKTGRNERV